MKKKPVAAGKSSFNLIDASKLFASMELYSDTFLLDLACGNGAYSVALAEHTDWTAKIFAVDLWREGIESLENIIRERAIPDIFPYVADVSKSIPVDTNSIDICLMATVLHDLIEDRTDHGTMKEVRRILKENGTLSVIEFAKIDGPPGPPKSIRLSPEELASYLGQYDFQVKMTLEIGPYNYLSTFTS